MNPNLAGKYGLEVVISGMMNVPFLGEIQVLNRSVLSVEIVQEAERYWHEQKVCWIESYDNTRVSETHIPSEFVSAIPPQRIETRIDPETVSWDPEAVHLGFKSNTNFPADGGNKALVDADNDGNPGVTVFLEIPLLGIVELYLVQHNDLLNSGGWTGQGYEGQINIQAMEQITLGSSHKVFRRSNTLTPDPSKSYFKLRPLKNNTCADLRHLYPPLKPEWRR